MKYHLDSLELCTTAQQLRVNGELKFVEPLIFRLLLYMFQHPNRVISYSELLQEVWQVAALSNSAINAAVSHARHALGECGRKPQYIQTVSGSGYRLSGEVICRQLNSDTLPTSLVSHSPQLPQRPSLAVLNFAVGEQSDSSHFLARGLCVDINAHLARLSHLFVIARPSADAVSHFAEPQRIAAKLGVRYLVNGSVFVSKGHCRVTLSLIDAENARQIWAEQLDHQLKDVLLLQQEAIQSLVAAIENAVTRAEIQRAISLPSQVLNAWELYHRGMWHIDIPTAEDTAKALHYFQQAVELDPAMCRGYAGMSIIFTTKIFVNVDGNTQQDLAIARDLALQALAHDKRDALANWAWGKVLYLAGDLHQAGQVFTKVVQEYPNYAHAHLAKAVVEVHTQAYVQGLVDLEQGEQLSPCDPLQYAQDAMRAFACVQQGNDELAADWAIRAASAPNAFFSTYAVAAACAWLDNRKQQSAQLVQQTLAMQPDFTIAAYQRSFPCCDENNRTRFIQAMHSAGLPA